MTAAACQHVYDRPIRLMRTINKIKIVFSFWTKTQPKQSQWRCKLLTPHTSWTAPMPLLVCNSSYVSNKSVLILSNIHPLTYYIAQLSYESNVSFAAEWVLVPAFSAAAPLWLKLRHFWVSSTLQQEGGREKSWLHFGKFCKKWISFDSGDGIYYEGRKSLLEK